LDSIETTTHQACTETQARTQRASWCHQETINGILVQIQSDAGFLRRVTVSHRAPQFRAARPVDMFVSRRTTDSTTCRCRCLQQRRDCADQLEFPAEHRAIRRILLQLKGAINGFQVPQYLPKRNTTVPLRPVRLSFSWFTREKSA
jgi:hypothetical protein